jgi:PTH1 family peptidyl-tRNA hydrolase
MKLIVGLGNPGPEYVGTRHNIGFEVLDRLAVRLGWINRAEDFGRLARTRFDGLTLDGALMLSAGGDERLLLLKPMTYMNVSGRSVIAAMQFHKLSVADVMIVLDDLALPVGRLRLRAGGSSGGHNGLRDIERVLGTSEYPRLRIGIDPAPPRIPGREYVLGRFTAEQRKELEPAIDRAAGAMVTWADKGIAAAMNQFNVAEADGKKE